MKPIFDNGDAHIEAPQKKCFACFSGQSLSSIVAKNPGILVFPRVLGANDDGVENSCIYSIEGDRIKTGNIVGFVGIGNERLSIWSRFDATSNKQYFLHYMLQRVFGINMLQLSTGIDKESIWDFLPYFFPYCLKKAINQGIFRTYREFKYNDDHVRGTIDIPAYINKDIPFCGWIAYRTREHSANNFVLQLIRHTIEYLRNDKRYAAILSADDETRQCVSTVLALTPDFSCRNLQKIVAKNLRPIQHPFFTEYTMLQRLCLQILRHEKITYGDDEREIHGILFDASWLWEEYLSTVLTPAGFIHPQNRLRKGGLAFYFDAGKEHYIGAYPDFYRNDSSLVLDAKYKPLEKRRWTDSLRDDRFQLISYMHIQKAKIGLLIYPTKTTSAQPEWEGTLRGYGGRLGIWGIRIPEHTVDFGEYSIQMDHSANEFIQWVSVGE